MQFFVILLSLFLFLSSVGNVDAIYDPLSVPNNKIGIHILFPEEIIPAAKLINNDGKGSWGYVTIPIQASDRNRDKWQKFFDSCKEQKVIPLVRVTTVPDGSNWAEPESFDLVDFANFLGDLKWPTQNKYVIIFNEVNRSDEYGGFVSPEKYADILNNAIDIFKNVSQDFFILPAGLDNAAANGKSSLNWRLYLERMYLRQPDVFNKIDGWTSHAYPNPAFSARPDYSGGNKIDSFKYDLRLIRQFTNKKLPVFITEAGWSNNNLSDRQIALYYDNVMAKAWKDENIVAITPFLLNAQDGPFKQFSFIGSDGQLKEFAKNFNTFSIKGEPKMPQEIIIEEKSEATPSSIPQVVEGENSPSSLLKTLYNNFMSLFGIFSK